MMWEGGGEGEGGEGSVGLGGGGEEGGEKGASFASFCSPKICTLTHGHLPANELIESKHDHN